MQVQNGIAILAGGTGEAHINMRYPHKHSEFKTYSDRKECAGCDMQYDLIPIIITIKANKLKSKIR